MNNNLLDIKGLGEKKSKYLEKIGITDMDSLLNYFPRKYEDRRKLYYLATASELYGKKCTFKLKIMANATVDKRAYKRSIVRATAFDGKNYCELIFFNQQYIVSKLYAGTAVYAYGECKRNGGKYELVNPELESIRGYKKMGKIMPLYSLTKGISNNDMAKFEEAALKINYNSIENVLTDQIIEEFKLMQKRDVILNLHFPKDPNCYSSAKRSLSFEKLFIFQLGIKLIKKKLNSKTSDILIDKTDYSDELLSKLPFKLTGAQDRVIKEINSDLMIGTPMNRLIQGDVGSGKTIVAIVTILNTINSGYQASFMAPTEILASQHFESITAFLENSSMTDKINIALLTGSTKASEKKRIIKGISSGEIDLLIGTHSLIEGNIIYKKLGLAVTDEQHRFGVRQRARLSNKGESVNVLVMTATPIPRTLSLIVYGDLNVSVIDELPPNRKSIVTEVVNKKNMKNVMEFIRQEIDKGRQAYIVTPLIETSEQMDVTAAEEVFDKLSRGYFADKKVVLLHGKLKSKQKDEIMMNFYRGKIDILISTTVIEVGVDVPNATIMMIMNAERFGLAQIHQLRGRVGRGEYQSYCFLVNGGNSEISRKRMDIIKNNSDGFLIAQEDLKIRGPGQYFGTVQHGIETYGIEELSCDINMLNETGLLAMEMVEDENFFKEEKYERIRNATSQLFNNKEIAMN